MLDSTWAPVIVYVLATVLGIWIKEVVANRMQAKNLAQLILAELEYDRKDTLQRLQKILSIPPEEFKATLAKDPLSAFLTTFDSYKSTINLLPQDVVETLFKLQKFHETVFENYYYFFLDEMAKYEDLESEEYDSEMTENYKAYLSYVQEAVQQKIFVIEDLMDQLIKRLKQFILPFYRKYKK